MGSYQFWRLINSDRRSEPNTATTNCSAVQQICGKSTTNRFVVDLLYSKSTTNLRLIAQMEFELKTPAPQIRWFSSDIARSINLLTYLLTYLLICLGVEIVAQAYWHCF